MRSSPEKNSGIALLVFTFLMMVNMIIHPAGGNIDHLLRIEKMIILAHTVALVAIPIGFVGFLGLARRLGTDNFLSITGLAFMSFALIAVMIAAATNGLLLPFFIERYRDASADMTESIVPLLKYNTTVNRAYDYIFTGFVCLAILCWSVTILRFRRMPVVIGYLGIALFLLVLVLFWTGISFSSLHGFRIFIAGCVVWICAVGVALTRVKVIV